MQAATAFYEPSPSRTDVPLSHEEESPAGLSGDVLASARERYNLRDAPDSDVPERIRDVGFVKSLPREGHPYYRVIDRSTGRTVTITGLKGSFRVAARILCEIGACGDPGPEWSEPYDLPGTG